MHPYPLPPYHAQRRRVRGSACTCWDFPDWNRPEFFYKGTSCLYAHYFVCRPRVYPQNLEKESVQKRIAALEQRFNGVKVIVGVDRLDYIKGVPQKLHGLELFLTQHPEWIGKVVLVQLAVPSRQDVEEYQNLRATVNELVGRINGRFGTVEFMPIHFMHKSLQFDELCALYALSDVCLVTSTRDGMNLVSVFSPPLHLVCAHRAHFRSLTSMCRASKPARV